MDLKQAYAEYIGTLLAKRYGEQVFADAERGLRRLRALKRYIRRYYGGALKESLEQ